MWTRRGARRGEGLGDGGPYGVGTKRAVGRDALAANPREY